MTNTTTDVCIDCLNGVHEAPIRPGQMCGCPCHIHDSHAVIIPAGSIKPEQISAGRFTRHRNVAVSDDLSLVDQAHEFFRAENGRLRKDVRWYRRAAISTAVIAAGIGFVLIVVMFELITR